MKGVRHILSDGICFFVTTVTSERRRAFANAGNCETLCNVIYNLRAHGRFLLAGFVVMPDHLHIAIFPTGSTLPEIIRDIKKGSARLINRDSLETGSLWQPGYWDRGVERQDELLQKLEYMVSNPLRAGLVADPRFYPWSTLNPRLESDLDRILGG